jgi:hypothetical protein
MGHRYENLQTAEYALGAIEVLSVSIPSIHKIQSPSFTNSFEYQRT